MRTEYFRIPPEMGKDSSMQHILLRYAPHYGIIMHTSLVSNRSAVTLQSHSNANHCMVYNPRRGHKTNSSQVGEWSLYFALILCCLWFSISAVSPFTVFIRCCPCLQRPRSFFSACLERQRVLFCQLQFPRGANHVVLHGIGDSSTVEATDSR